MNRNKWRVKTAAGPLYDDGGGRVMALVDRDRRTVWIDPQVRPAERPALVRDAMAVAATRNDDAAARATGERLSAAENGRLAGDFADFVVRLYGEFGAGLIRDGYRVAAVLDDMTVWTHPGPCGPDLPLYRCECHHCGHALREPSAMSRHVQRKHGVWEVHVLGHRWRVLPVPDYPKGHDGARCKLVLDPANRRALYADRLAVDEAAALLAGALSLYERERGGRAAA